MILSAKERIVFKMRNISPTRGHKDKNMIQYDNVADDVSLRYTITAEKVKEEITIPSPESPISYSYSFKSYGLEPQFDKSQTLQFVDSNGNAKVIVPAPFVEDANGEVFLSNQYRLRDKWQPC